MRHSVSVATMRELDRAAIEDYGIPAVVLMENAGAGAAREIRAELGDTALGRGVLVVAGKGNNGGDGYVVARHFHNAGFAVTVAATGAPSSEESRMNHEAARALGLAVIPADRPDDWPGCGCIVDALLGVGFSGALRDDAAALVQAMNERAGGSPIAALDVPSGLDADTGRAAEPTVRAAITTTFGAIKRGLLTPTAEPYVGKLVLVEISIPRELLPRETSPLP